MLVCIVESVHRFAGVAVGLARYFVIVLDVNVYSSFVFKKKTVLCENQFCTFAQNVGRYK